MGHPAGSSAWPPPVQAGASAELISEIESLRRERDELRELVRKQEKDLSPRARGHGPGAGGRARSLERRHDLERLVTAQEATQGYGHVDWQRPASPQGSPRQRQHASPSLSPRVSSREASPPKASPPKRMCDCRWMPCSCGAVASAQESSPPKVRMCQCRWSPCCCGAVSSRRSASASGHVNLLGRRSPSAGRVPTVGVEIPGRPSPSAGRVPTVGAESLLRGSARRGPEGCGSGIKRQSSMPSAGGPVQARPSSSSCTPHRPPRPTKQAPALAAPRAISVGRSGRSPRNTGGGWIVAGVGRSPRNGGLEDALGEALRGLGSAQGALAEASRQLSQEAHRRSGDAWRIQRLEQVMAASLGGFGRELRALREADNPREKGRKPRCHSTTCCHSRR